MAKSEKTAASKPSGGKAAADQQTPAASNTKLYIVGAAVVAALIGGVAYWWATSSTSATTETGDVAVEELMAPGPLEDIALGKADAPYTIVEYASMTCPHCAQFHKVVLPEIQEKYIDTGQARLILREFPLDGLAMAAFMLARCAGPDRYYPMVGALFETQETWAVPGTDGKEKLRLIAKQAGFSNEQFEQCLADKALFDKIAETRKIAHEKFGVDSTPSFFVNGKRLKGEHELKDFEALMGKETAPGTSPAPGTTSGTDGSASQ